MLGRGRRDIGPAVSVLWQAVPVGGHARKPQAGAHQGETVRVRAVRQGVPDQRQPVGAQARAQQQLVADEERSESDDGPRRRSKFGRRSAVPVHVLLETVPYVHGPVKSRARAHPRKAVRVFRVRQVFPNQVQPDGTHEGLSRHGLDGLRIGRSASVHVQDTIGDRRIGVRVTSWPVSPHHYNNYT